MNYLSKMNLLLPNQQGFRKDHLAFMALLDMHAV